MNCPSRTDDITLEHPSWNQSPPPLAADLTTCEDLNGKVNTREHRSGGSGDGTLGDSQSEKDFLTHPMLNPDRHRPQLSGRWSDSFHPRTRDVLGGEDQPRPAPWIPSQATRSSAWGWISWTASVLVCSFLLSSSRTPGFLTSLFSAPAHAHAHHAHAQQQNGEAPAPSSPVNAGITNDEYAMHFTRHMKRDGQCGGGGANVEEYDVPLHVGGLFIILASSFFSCAFPLFAKKFTFLRVPSAFFFAVRHFGTGVLIATAFVHLLPTAFISLGDDCLSSFWIDDYDAMPGAIALAAIFFVAVIEMVFQPARHMVPDQRTGAAGAPAVVPITQPAAGNASASSSEDEDGDETENETRGQVPDGRGMGSVSGAANSLGRTLSRIGRDSDIAVADNDATLMTNDKPRVTDTEAVAANTPVGTRSRQPSFAGYTLSPAQKHQKEVLQCMMLEVGILFHSVFIGMTLSVSTGSSFVVLLIAIAFHQIFEGLALGSRIAAIKWHEGALQPWLMALAFGCTTPIGQAIGIATHSLYDPESEFGLVLVGTMNAISSGLLVFASLVELLSEDFLSDESWRTLRGKKRVVACLLVFAGAFGMSVIGAWA